MTTKIRKPILREFVALPGQPTTERTPEQHRAAVEAWRAAAPANDSEIFGRKLSTAAPRHRSMGAMAGLRAFAKNGGGFVEGGKIRVRDFATLATTWALVPANDNSAPAEGFGSERQVEYRPSMQKIEEAMAMVVCRERAEPAMLSADDRARELHGIPLSGEFEYGQYLDDEGNAHQTIVRIGKLKFSDGTQTEKGSKLVFGKPVNADIRMPVGAMLGCAEKSVQDKGSDIDETGSNSHYRWIVSARSARQPTKKGKRGERLEITKAEAMKMLQDAASNTPVLPTVTKCKDGFPYAPSSLRQLFIGGRKGKQGESGSVAWEDIAVQHENKRQFAVAMRQLNPEDAEIMEDAIGAKSLAQLGEARGYKGRHAVEAGRRLLIAANDNFEKALEIAQSAREA